MAKKIANISYERNGEWIHCGSLLKSKGFFVHMNSIPLNLPCICRPFEDAEYINGDIMSGESKIGFIYSDSTEREYYVITFLSMPTGAGKQFKIKEGEHE